MIQDVVIVGGGLVGSLAACILQQQQPPPRVRIYELRGDLRLDKQTAGKSINLALSHRGLRTLQRLNPRVMAQIQEMMIPMRGRMLHTDNAKQQEVLYGTHGECINSVDRKKLNEILLTEFEVQNGGEIFFQYSLQSIDFSSNECLFLHEGKEVVVSYDLLIGADGAYSAVRQLMQRRNRMQYAQEYIDHGYMELTIGPQQTSSGAQYAMSSDHLHIWPKHTFMMIALPNVDKSFTTTLFMPFSKFDQLRAEGHDAIVTFFKQNFNDAISLLGGEDAVVKSLQNNVVGPMVSIKCSPYNYENAVIIGDAIHAMVPFYGQGMNAGFEDVFELEHFLFAFDEDLSVKQKLEAFSQHRKDDAQAICDLAMYNYHEMRNDVLTLQYRVRKQVESTLNRIVPWLVIPLYSMVSFSHIRYSVAVQRWRRQSIAFNVLSGGVIGGLVGVVCVFGAKNRYVIGRQFEKYILHK